MIFTTILRSPGLAALALLLATLPALAQPQKSSQDQLPEMGTAAQAALSLEDESQIGRMVMRNLREAGMVLDDPEVHEYIQSLGLRLSSLAQDGNRNFNFFVVRDPAINAFALPGGYVGIHSGLMLETRNESELAGVLAHEVAHVTAAHRAWARSAIACEPDVDRGSARGNPGGRGRRRQFGRDHGCDHRRPEHGRAGRHQLHARQRIRG